MTLRAIVFAATIAAAFAVPPDPPRSGVDLASIDASVRPQDDLYRFANGRWLDAAVIAPDRSTAGTFVDLFDRTERDLHAVAERAAAAHLDRGSPAQKIGDLYASYMDEARVEQLGWTPIQAELARIAGLRTASEFAKEAGYLSSISAGGPFGNATLVDADHPEQFIVQITQGGLLLPNREYYLSDLPAMRQIRSKYEAYLTQIFTLVGRSDARDAARLVLDIETAIARAQLPPLESRDAARMAGELPLADLPALMPGFDWTAWIHAQGIDRIGRVSFAQPAFFKAFAALVPTFPIDAWKAYLSARHIYWLSPNLSSAFVDARFEFFGRALNGQSEPRPRWKVGVGIVNAFLGDALGRLYVEERFPKSAKDRAERLVRQVVSAYGATIKETGWLSVRTKAEALEKLSRLRVRVGYPEHWRDYSKLEIKADDLVGNYFRGQLFETYFRALRSRGASDAAQWIVGAQSVNAFYVPGTNELVLPAAVLQPPLFDVEADDAVNYGSIGMLIAHEISHAFDERVVPATPAEDLEYRRRLRPLVTQFSAYSPLPGETINGDLTFAENVADLEGVSVAYRAYTASLSGKSAPVLDQFTGPQRFFLGFAHMWRTRVREDYLRQWLLNFAYAPYEFRTNGSVCNLPEFQEAFHVQTGDGLHRPAEERARGWGGKN